MMEINQDIISEIKGLTESNSRMREFLIWLMNFERERLDKERPGYKQEIMKQIDIFITDK